MRVIERIDFIDYDIVI